jgi:hypothetical protein|tara:strand:- start:2801 stop:3145 length:345 start_codon:yes stop_codon:yes gene_type:complete
MAIYANLNIDQGSDFFSVVSVEGSNGLPYDLTGHTAAGVVRRNYTSTTSYPFVVTINNPVRGDIEIAMDNTVTSTMKPGRYVYDIEITETVTSDKTRVIEGQVEIAPGVTSNGN